jgi:hypothetical protein
MSETDRAALLAYVQHKPKCDSFHCGCEHCYPDVKHLPPGVYVHTYQPRSCDCGLDVLLTTLESSDQTPALRALVEQWRERALSMRSQKGHPSMSEQVCGVIFDNRPYGSLNRCAKAKGHDGPHENADGSSAWWLDDDTGHIGQDFVETPEEMANRHRAYPPMSQYPFAPSPAAASGVPLDVGMIEQFCRDLNDAHNEILRLQGVQPEDYSKYDWPEWSAPANSIRWAERVLGKPLSKTSLRSSPLPAEAQEHKCDGDCKRSELHARINQAVSDALGQPMGASWHDLGQKVAALKARAEAQEPWQLIDSAPKDGTRVLIGFVERGQRKRPRPSYVGEAEYRRWDAGGAWWWPNTYDEGSIDPPPTHWMPLPTPPAARHAPSDTKGR